MMPVLNDSPHLSSSWQVRRVWQPQLRVPDVRRLPAVRRATRREARVTPLASQADAPGSKRADGRYRQHDDRARDVEEHTAHAALLFPGGDLARRRPPQTPERDRASRDADHVLQERLGAKQPDEVAERIAAVALLSIRSMGMSQMLMILLLGRRTRHASATIAAGLE